MSKQLSRNNERSSENTSESNSITVDSDEWEEVPVKKDNKSDSESESESFIATQLTYSQQERKDEKKKHNKEITEKKPRNENETNILMQRRKLVILKSVEQLAKSLKSVKNDIISFSELLDSFYL
ncbi:hypothetical protein EIN_150580 [Entamoeba invadens IP1]|uniref:Uncharacterized protein n=1 Tax=Entamoeba invadens IP1 TaxID=370355 RepID=A0A0A1UEE2_ENTIV|nr:hypothetical protein EIN_150580 [Entamoeba invadens IP1]ELP91191.1 hypothetical protein EIN_150580 [Entamoeba invadens IP1]|eukprot:XP_004257962.1 hypothetical protein EIN_150580 [Entamoeba invadens IP1]